MIRKKDNYIMDGEKKGKSESSGILDNYECDGQMSIYDFPEWLPDSMNEERDLKHGKEK
jgi:hypothetical protein